MKYAQKTSAVSPIVATLVLIVVAVVGAVAVGTIMGTFSNSVSKQTDASQASSASQTELLTGGSTTVQPASEQIAKVYMVKNPGIKITVSGGGSGAGVAQTASGVLDIGASSDLSKITDWQSAHPTDDLRYTQIGGSGIVWIANGATAANMSKGDIKSLYANGTAANGITKAIQRSDSSGTEEGAAKWLSAGADKSLDGYTCGGDSAKCLAANGNAGVLALVGTTANSIGFVDLGYAFDSSGVSKLGTGVSVINPGNDAGTDFYITSRTNILNACKDLNNGKTSSSSYPLSFKSDGTGTGLVRGLYYLTKGLPTPIESNYINFAASPSSCDAMHLAGVFCNADLA